jgi:hypothetical protein
MLCESEHLVARAMLSGNDDNFRRRSVLKSIIWDDLQSAADCDRIQRLRHSVKLERAVHHATTGDGGILKNFPGTGEIDQHRALGDYEGDIY